MVTLTLLHLPDPKPVRHWRFAQETLIRIGRAPENHIILNNPIVSRFHAELRRIDLPRRADSQTPIQGWQLINHSVNGTFVNGEAIAQGILEDEVLIQLAQEGPVLRFQLESRSSSPTIAFPAQSSPPQLPDPTQSTAPTRCTHAGNPADNLFCIHCGQPIRVEKTVRQYQVLRVLGRGGMGTTYLVWNPMGVPRPRGAPIGKLQVLKEMNADVARIPKAQELFEREASTLKTLEHPGIPRYYDFFIENDKKYLVMELIHGRDMEKRVRQQGPVAMEQAIGWMVQTCEVLDYLHNRPTPIIHRDIKPGNLLVRNVDQRVVVLDFGAVKAAGLAPGTRIGAEGYSAPEQVQGRPVIQSDLYAIGPSLVFLLTGMSPLRLQRRGDSSDRFDLDKIAGLSRRLQLVIWRVTEIDPANRYQTAKELIHALKNCL
ncbi:MAG: protein kinase [Oscillatoriales cyanobacterium C42_A2020_001]|nr:protein kinase [Leptolyngbyaceae cyanobacterium C42_A2020_001]